MFLPAKQAARTPRTTGNTDKRPGDLHSVTRPTRWGPTLIVTFVTALIALAQQVDAQQTDDSLDERPNVMIIMADDLGFSDLGCYGGEIDTPNLDQLAADGIRYRHFYNTARCWPTRGSLLTGYYAQPIKRDKLPGYPGGGMPGERPEWAPLVPVLLGPAGYRNYHTGKWHIDGMPISEGFDRSYYLADQARFFSPNRRFLDDQRLPAIPRGTGYYATTDLANRAIEVLRDHAENHSDQPFFHYIALTAPHFPLHALPEDIRKYRGRYQAGWDKVRDERWKRIQQLGILDGELSEVETETGAPYKRPQDVKAFGPGEVPLPKPWDELTPKQQEFQATKMTIHAAMVDRIDQEVGRVFDQMKAMGEFENTLILFFSDNGCSSELMIRDDGHDPEAPPGSADTHLCLGPGWSTVSNTPFRKHKTWVHEGGIATPLIAHWPRGISPELQGQLCNEVGHVIDLVPTILELASVPPPASYHGMSLTPTFKGKRLADREYLWWSHENHNAIRISGWKAVKTADGPWELYHLDEDPAETENLAGERPDHLSRLVDQWKAVRDEFIQLIESEDGPSQ